MKRTDQARLNAEYQRLVSGLADSGLGRASGGVAGSTAAGSGGGAAGPAGAAAEEVAAAADSIPANPALPADILQEAVPGNIRRAEHFVSFMRKVRSVARCRLCFLFKCCAPMCVDYVKCWKGYSIVLSRKSVWCVRRRGRLVVRVFFCGEGVVGVP